MPTIAEIRRQYPQYNDMSDTDLADTLHSKYYSDMPKEEFQAKIGLSPTTFTSGVLPFTKNAQGQVSFDPNVGVLGGLKQMGKEALSLETMPQDVISGKLDPMSQEAKERAAPAGLFASPLTPGLRVGEGLAAALLPKKPPVPTAPELLSAGGAARQSALDMGVDYTGSSVAGLAQRLKAQLIEGTINSEAAPKVFEILDRRANAPADAIFQLSDVLTFRDALKDARLDFEHPRQKLAADRIIAELDKFVQRPPAGSVMAGPAADAATVLAEGRANSAVGFRSQRLTGEAEERSTGRPGVLPKAEAQAAAANSGRNVGNAIRQRVRDLLNDPKARAGFNPEELKALEAVRDGTTTINTVRYVANLLGGGGGLGQAIVGLGGAGLSGTGGALATGSPGTAIAAALAGTAPMAAGAGLKMTENALTKRALKAADELVRKRSPLAETLAKAAPQPVKTPTGRAALARALLKSIMPPGVDWQLAPPQQPVPLTQPYSPYRT